MKELNPGSQFILIGLDFLALGAVVIAGLVNLAYPFAGDQALFTLGGRALAEGAVLYRDFWELKQPGILYFYFLAGQMFGFTEKPVKGL